MADARDWLKTLWPASYKGVPFYFESDEEEGGRGLVIHKFPHRDDPFVEDLGEEPRFYSGSAYLHGDDVDAQAARLAEMLATRGVGTLVVPLRGPVQVHCQTFKRRHEKDHLGFVAFEIKFVREGARFGLISLPLALNLAFGAAQTLVGVIASTFAARVRTLDRPDHVVAAAADGVAAGAAALDTVRLTRAVDPDVSAKVRDAVADIVATSGEVFASDDPGQVSALASTLIETTRALADGMTPDLAAAAMTELAEAFAETPPPAAWLSPSAEAEARNTAEAHRLMRLAALTALAEATMRRTYASRPDGVTSRAMIAARFEVELESSGGAENAALYVALADLRGRVIEYLSRLINDLAPVVTVEATRQLPSLFWAWRLYADPQRSGELVARNGVRHPSFIPATFEALAR